MESPNELVELTTRCEEELKMEKKLVVFGFIVVVFFAVVVVVFEGMMRKRDLKRWRTWPNLQDGSRGLHNQKTSSC